MDYEFLKLLNEDVKSLIFNELNDSFKEGDIVVEKPYGKQEFFRARFELGECSKLGPLRSDRLEAMLDYYQVADDVVSEYVSLKRKHAK